MNVRFSEYRVMWILVFFDLPTETKEERHRHSEFRKSLLKDGFNRFQLSIYTRCCPTVEHANMHIKRVRNFIPPKGTVSIMCVTDKQFGKIVIFHGPKERPVPKVSPQLELF